MTIKNLNHLAALLQEGYTTIGVRYAPSLSSAEKSVIREMVAGGCAPWEIKEYRKACESSRAQSQGAVYTFKAHFECMIGDQILVHGSDGNIVIVECVRVDAEPQLNFESDIEYKWAIGRVDTSTYDAVVKREAEMINGLRHMERARQRQELLQQLEATLPADGEARKIFDQARQIGQAITKA